MNKCVENFIAAKYEIKMKNPGKLFVAAMAKRFAFIIAILHRTDAYKASCVTNDVRRVLGDAPRYVDNMSAKAEALIKLVTWCEAATADYLDEM